MLVEAGLFQTSAVKVLLYCHQERADRLQQKIKNRKCTTVQNNTAKKQNSPFVTLIEPDKT